MQTCAIAPLICVHTLVLTCTDGACVYDYRGQGKTAAER